MNFSLGFILLTEKAQSKAGITGVLQSSSTNPFTLSTQIQYFVENEKRAIQSTLKYFYRISVRYVDKIKILGFAYASIYTTLMGNLTANPHKYLNDMDSYSLKIRFKRLGFVMDTENITIRYYDITIPNNFAKLKFVSCGSKGLEPFPFQQFVSVFEDEVWICIAVAGTILVLTISIITGKNVVVGLYNNLFGILKVILEQGHSFDTNPSNQVRLRLTWCGALLAGIVISNAFKSENMFKIVMPRNQISYKIVDELLKDDFQLYTRLWYFWYQLVFADSTEEIIKKDWIRVHYNGSWMAIGESETSQILHKRFNEHATVAKLCNNTRLHPKALEVFVEPVKLLEPLVKVGLINTQNSMIFDQGMAMVNRFWKNQNELIWSDLNACNRSAWILPEYLGHLISRKLQTLVQLRIINLVLSFGLRDWCLRPYSVDFQ